MTVTLILSSPHQLVVTFLKNVTIRLKIDEM